MATAGGAGLAPIAPGTAGSAVGLVAFWALASLPLALYALTVTAAVFLGVWAAEEAERAFARRDDRRIVIDEVAGQLVALTPLVVLGRERSLAWIAVGFVLFRLFDVWKPGPVRAAERRLAGGVAVMMDDVAAGLLAAGALGVLVLAGVAGAHARGGL